MWRLGGGAGLSLLVGVSWSFSLKWTVPMFFAPFMALTYGGWFRTSPETRIGNRRPERIKPNLRPQR